MNAQDAVDAILAIFKTAWDAYPGAPPAVYGDVAAAPPAGDTVWARAIVRHATGAQSSLASDVGTRRFTSKGFVWVQVFAPAGDGSTGARAAAQAIANAYRDARLQDVWFRNVQLNELGSDGAFERVDVKANFEYDDVR